MANDFMAQLNNYQSWSDGLSQYNQPTIAMPTPGMDPVTQQISQGLATPNVPGTETEGSGILGAFNKWLEESGFLKQTNADGSTNGGWGSALLGTGQGIMNGWLGMQQLGVAKDSLKEGKRQFNLNYENQRKLTNAELSDRQTARNTATRGQDTMSTAEYMSKYGV